MTTTLEKKTENIRTCIKCGKQSIIEFPDDFEGWENYIQSMWLKVAEKHVCPKCDEIRQKELQTEADKQRRSNYLYDWQLLCPAAIRNTNLNHPGINTKKAGFLMSHNFAENRFVLLTGNNCNGKTRAAFKKIEEPFFYGETAEVITGTGLKTYIREINNLTAEQKNERIKHPKYLILDDVHDAFIGVNQNDWLISELTTILKTRQLSCRNTIIILQKAKPYFSEETKHTRNILKDFFTDMGCLTINFDE